MITEKVLYLKDPPRSPVDKPTGQPALEGEKAVRWGL